jgi:spectinomycin phosphotransferase
MIEKPDITDERIIACLQTNYGLRIQQVTFLPLGGDLNTAVYRTQAEEGTRYFCKLRRNFFNTLSVEIPRFLSEQGLTEIISPILTHNGQLWAALDEFCLILYPFVDGQSGFDVELTRPQWDAFGKALKRIHTTTVPAWLAQKIEMESYSPEWRDRCRGFIQRLDSESFEDPITLQLVDYYRSRRKTLLYMLEYAEQYAGQLASRINEVVLCHTDIHPGNLFIDRSGSLFIIDWDYPKLALKECDLMFIGGGQGYVGTTGQDEEARFYSAYGQGMVDALAMAYYRCERNIVDFSVECGRILSSQVSDADRAKSLLIITWLFGPGGSIEMAYKSAALLDQISNEE